jgi:GDPmannose 4,6-dehydratase
VGAGRQESSKFIDESVTFSYKQIDLRSQEALYALLQGIRPEVICHFAAVHGFAGTTYESIWQDMLAVNLGSLQTVFEYLRRESPNGKVIYAGSGKVFGPSYPKRITERSMMRSPCLYTITKSAARNLINYYRKQHKINGTNLILFNHESERRPKDFFVPKIVEILVNSIHDRLFVDSVVTLDFECDWGSSEEYMELVVDIVEKASNDDYLIGTGKTLNARRFVETLFGLYGLDYRKHILTESSSSEGERFNGSYRVVTKKLEESISRKPQYSIFEVCETILQRNYAITDQKK